MELPAMNTYSTTASANESSRIIHQLQDGPDISLDGDSIVFNPNNIDDDIRGKFEFFTSKTSVENLVFFFFFKS